MGGSSTNGVIFDLDGTLVDSLQDIVDAMEHALAALELPSHSRASYERFIGDGARMLVRRAIAPALVLEEEALELFRRRYEANLVVHTRPFAGVEPLLEELARRGVPTAVLSNKPHAWTEAIVRALFASHPFRAVRGHLPPALHKPDPGSALELARALRRSPDRVLFVGDTSVDVETAHRAGMIAVGAGWGMRPDDLAHARHHLARPRELLAIV